MVSHPTRIIRSPTRRKNLIVPTKTLLQLIRITKRERKRKVQETTTKTVIERTISRTQATRIQMLFSSPPMTFRLWTRLPLPPRKAQRTRTRIVPLRLRRKPSPMMARKLPWPLEAPRQPSTTRIIGRVEEMPRRNRIKNCTSRGRTCCRSCNRVRFRMTHAKSRLLERRKEETDHIAAA